MQANDGHGLILKVFIVAAVCSFNELSHDTGIGYSLFVSYMLLVNEWKQAYVLNWNTLAFGEPNLIEMNATSY